MSHEPDDPKNPDRPKPPVISQDPDHQHIPRVIAKMKGAELEAGKLKADFKDFMVLAWMAEVNRSVYDAVLVEERLNAFQTMYYFADRPPPDPQFAQRYAEMQKQFEENRAELVRALNKIAALETELAQYRG